jgi:hypothetical protein
MVRLVVVMTMLTMMTTVVCLVSDSCASEHLEHLLALCHFVESKSLFLKSEHTYRAQEEALNDGKSRGQS